MALRDELMKRARGDTVRYSVGAGGSYGAGGGGAGGGIQDDLSYRAACAIDVVTSAITIMRREAVHRFDLQETKRLDNLLAVLKGR